MGLVQSQNTSELLPVSCNRGRVVSNPGATPQGLGREVIEIMWTHRKPTIETWDGPLAYGVERAGVRYDLLIIPNSLYPSHVTFRLVGGQILRRKVRGQSQPHLCPDPSRLFFAAPKSPLPGPGSPAAASALPEVAHTLPGVAPPGAERPEPRPAQPPGPLPGASAPAHSHLHW